MKPAVFVCYRPHLQRDVVLAKLVRVGNRWVLGVPYRGRARLRGRISLPLELLTTARARGAGAIIVRLEPERAAYELPIDEALRVGELAHIDGVPERWWPLSAFRAIRFPQWPYLDGGVERVRIGPPPESFPRQLPLPLAG